MNTASARAWTPVEADTSEGTGVGATCLRPGGSLTTQDALAFRRAIRREAQAGVRSLLLDLRSVSAIDAAGVAALVDGARAVAAAHGEVRLAANPLVARALRHTGTIGAFRLWRPGVDSRVPRE